jgi:TetR/AcrR family transcriptional repressor of nem operon
MHDRGYEAVGIAELCQVAGVKRGSFYFHFETKQALALEMLDRSWERTRLAVFGSSIEDETLSAGDAIARYGNLLADLLATVLDERAVVAGCRFGNFAVELATRDEPVRARVEAIFDQMIALVAATIERSVDRGELAPEVDPQSSATAVIAHMEGLMVMAKARRQPDILRGLGDAARLLLRRP